jgi:hypothetical protein
MNKPPRSPTKESTMHSNANTCSRCRFFSRNACSTRHCHDWRSERSVPGQESDWADQRQNDDEPEDRVGPTR